MKLLPKLTGREPPCEVERCLFALPPRAGGLNLPDPTSFSTTQYRDSKKITAPFTELILAQSRDYSYDALFEHWRQNMKSSSPDERYVMKLPLN